MIHVMTSLLMLVVIADKDTAASKTAAARTPTPELRIDSGALRGLVVGDKKDVHVYKGIPYAASTAGVNRWKPPQPVTPWQGVRDCFEFGAACPQKIPPLFANIPEMAIRAPFNEDCLFANVWTPAERKSDKLPVLYWIHGGGYIMGAASQSLYDGEELARLGCVVVSINYRVGLFGFLAHAALSQESSQGVSGNYGLLDQIEGLHWVKRNISAFGGDPDHVAIFGESAGGGSVLCLMVSPQARGLFQAAIAQSAPTMNMIRLREAPSGQETAEQAGQRFMAACGLNDSVDAGRMRKIDAKALVEAGGTEPGPGAPLRLKPGPQIVAPVVDGQVIPDNPNVLFASGREHSVPMIVGNTRDEMSMMLLGTKLPADAAAYEKKLKDDFGELGEAVAKAYPASNPREIRAAAIQLTSDLTFVSETRAIARTHSAAGQKTFRYQFSRGTNRAMLKPLGAHHGAEVAFLFQRPVGRDESETRTARAMGQYWINLAVTGDPNGQGLPNWPYYRPDSEEMIDFGNEIRVLKGHRNAELDLIEKILQATANFGTNKTGK
jgi:para-nitrobenzyl esterase